MPGFRSHYLFGRNALTTFTPNNHEQFLIRYPQSYHMGLQGPDVFFYYIPAYVFFDKNIDYFSEEQKQRKLQRNKKIKKWQKEGILLQYDLRNFRQVNYHFVAAHIDGNTGIQPIRIEEPFVGIVEDFIRREGKQRRENREGKVKKGSGK